ncbi:MAG: hypothetical protein JSV92_02800 [archaeon]|nr:MAG: hypothetical protein JSV92_02800 [archaeon]
MGCLEGQSFKWNAFLGGCGFRYTEHSGKDFYRSKKYSHILYRINEGGPRGCDMEYPYVGIYITNERDIKEIHNFDKSSFEYKIKEKMDKIKKENPDRHYWKI